MYCVVYIIHNFRIFPVLALNNKATEMRYQNFGLFLLKYQLSPLVKCAWECPQEYVILTDLSKMPWNKDIVEKLHSTQTCGYDY